MKANQRVVKSIPDKSGNPYTKTNAGGKARMQAAANYMDERENTQLYTLENNQIRETDRYQVNVQIEDTETRYQQHLTFTTTLNASDTMVNEREAAEYIAQAIRERRPDAQIYAIAVHSDGKGDEKGVHVHAIVGTETTLRRDDLRHFREEAHGLEQHIERDNTRELSQVEREWVQERQVERQYESMRDAHRERGQELEQ